MLTFFLFFTLDFHPRFMQLRYVHIILAHVNPPNYARHLRVNESTCICGFDVPV